MQNKINPLYLSFFLLIAIFISLAVWINYVPIPALDLQISLFVQKHESASLDKVMLFISLFGELPYSLIMVVVIALVFFLFKYKREAYYILSILSTGLIILGVKSIIDRPRPTEEYVRLVEINRYQSFPSGHVLSYIVFFGFMLVLMRNQKNIPKLTRIVLFYISLFFMLTIPISRIYLGAHWFTDTVGGVVLGLACLIPLSDFYLKTP